MPLHIGIVACSTEGAALCYRTISLEGAQVLGSRDHPEVSPHPYSLAKYMQFKRPPTHSMRGGLSALRLGCWFT
jgi:hypothetical protein